MLGGALVGGEVGKAIDGDLIVLRRKIPAKVRKRKGKPDEIVKPETDVEVHVNPKSLAFVGVAALVAALAAGVGWLTWNGVHVANPVPIGDRVLTLVPGLKDDPAIQARIAARRKRQCEGRGEGWVLDSRGVCVLVCQEGYHEEKGVCVPD